MKSITHPYIGKYVIFMEYTSSKEMVGRVVTVKMENNRRVLRVMTDANDLYYRYTEEVYEFILPNIDGMVLI